MSNEGQALDMGVTVSALVALGTSWFLEHSDLLVVSNGWHLRCGGFAKLANGESVHLETPEATGTIGSELRIWQQGVQYELRNSGRTFQGALALFRHALWIAIAINVTSVKVKVGARVLSQLPTADSAIYEISFAVIGRHLVRHAPTALHEGRSLHAMGVVDVATADFKLFVDQSWQVDIKGVIGATAPVANVVSLPGLPGYRNGDFIDRSVLLRGRIDAITNVTLTSPRYGISHCGPMA